MASQKLLTTVVPQTSSKATAVLIFLHGSGDTGKGLREWIRLTLGGELKFPHMKVIYPTAPKRPYTPLKGAPSNVWFDRHKIAFKVPEHEDTEAGFNLVKQLITEEMATSGVPANRIIIAGFSMGGSLALHVAYKLEHKLAGCICLSSFLNEESSVYRVLESQRATKYPPLFMCHGELDALVNPEWSRATFAALQNYGIEGTYHSFPTMLHELEKRELDLVVEWILKRVPVNL